MPMQPDQPTRSPSSQRRGLFQRLLALGRDPNRAVKDAVYSRIVAAARQPVFYSTWNVPDTPLGRFEMLSLHMFLFLHRMREETGVAHALAQDLTDDFFTDVDHSLRELGIGDMGVPKRMKKLARMFYGRATTYGAALDAGDATALTAALMRNVRPEAKEWAEASALAGYALAADSRLASQPTGAILSGAIEFPVAGAMGGEA